MHILLAALAATLATGPQLVTPSWLAAHLADPDLVILHVGPPDKYATHIAGAQRVDPTQLWANAGPNSDTTALSVEMLPPEVLRARLESYGISDRSTVVVYAAADQWRTVATRVILTLRVAGLGAKAALLDGGLKAWTADGRPLSSDVPHPTAGHITATPVPSLVVDATWVQAHLKRPQVVLIDARDLVFYNGTEQGESRRGHIPTAQSLPFTAMFDSAGRFKTRPALESLFRGVGAQPGDTIVAYCHIGLQATAVLFAADQLGHPVRFYDGSFEDWANRKELPVIDPSMKSK